MLPKGSTVPTPLPTPHQIVDRLKAAAEAWARPPAFGFGDVVRSAPFVAGFDLGAPGNGEAIVMETCLNLREMTGDLNMPQTQGLMLAFITLEGVNFGWYGAWQYVKAAPLPVRPLNA